MTKLERSKGDLERTRANQGRPENKPELAEAPLHIHRPHFPSQPPFILHPLPHDRSKVWGSQVLPQPQVKQLGMRESPSGPSPQYVPTLPATLPLFLEVAQLLALLCFLAVPDLWPGTYSTRPALPSHWPVCPPCWYLPISLPPVSHLQLLLHPSPHLSPWVNLGFLSLRSPSSQCMLGGCVQLSERPWRAGLRRRRKGGCHLLLGDCAPTFPAPIECFQGNLEMWSVW